MIDNPLPSLIVKAASEYHSQSAPSPRLPPWTVKVLETPTHSSSLVTLMPVVFDENEIPVTSDESLLTPVAYDQLRQSISLAPGQALSFVFTVFLPEDITVDENYEIVVESEASEPARDDLDILFDDFDTSEWPWYFIVEGNYANPGANLEDHIAIVVTVYDNEERVIGVGWVDENENPALLEPGEHEFIVETEMWEIADTLGLEAYSYKVQIFGR